MTSLEKYPFLKACFWSYRLTDLDVQEHKALIIKQVLNYGSVEATNWLRGTYSEIDIQAVMVASIESEWEKKSLALWSLIYAVYPKRTTRFL